MLPLNKRKLESCSDPFASIHSTAQARSAHKIAALISGRGSNLRSIVENQSVALVISNVADAPGLLWAQAQGIKTAVVAHADFATREEFDQAISNLLQTNNINLVLLAGFMRILTEGFVKQWQGRMLNIHPSLLPLYPGLNTHARALAAGDKQAGASVHFVTPQLDGGPVIIQGIVDIQTGDTADSLAARVLEVEHKIYPLALQWLLSGRATLQQNHYHLDGHIPSAVPVWYLGDLQQPGINS